ncbi:hypothetical protein RND81_14G234800 [Saponaria officinalis]|uniref:B-like cyclin n=1 Tax=Saponaria officinalis TaxID=3572 RepID=A0AAW1GQK1_SAPOF
MAISCLFDELYCEEQNWDENDENEEIEYQNQNENTFLQPIMLLNQDIFWEDEELKTLFLKEKQSVFNSNVSLINGRKESVEWMLKVNLKYGFSALTTILSVNYFDRCIANIPFIQLSKPWTLQLAAVTCVSLAAKVEETCVPFLLDLQVEGANPVFEPRDVQKMELLVLSALEWKMHPVTPLSFLHHIIRRLGLTNHVHWEFLNKCEALLLSLLYDWRFVSYLPSVLASATMMHVIDQIEASNPLEYQTQLLSVLNISKEEVKECYELIVEKSSSMSTKNDISIYKRKFEQIIMPNSPSGVMDAYHFISESSNDSWAVDPVDNNPVSVSVSSSPVRKKGRVHEKPMPLQLPSMSRVFVDFVPSPR